MRISVRVSMEEVASSRISMGGRQSMTRAMHSSCFWPWLRLPPSSAMTGVVALRQALDEAVGMGSLGRGDDLLIGGVGLAVGDVLPHGARSQPGVLQHHAVAAPQGARGSRRGCRVPATVMEPPSTS